ncbi:hypothetical protein [Mesonia mobilis]|uniref:hypothetical protein n=1 Tax=Mesonia mobilis TaxID=369791 RepID=UPI0026EBA62C|nr:hypothetical protein [Mesonia mobilis]
MPTDLTNQLSELITPFIVALLMLVISLWFKDFATKIAKGLAFSLNKSFQEGDKVILDGERALIVKVGLTQTVFGITKSNGEWDGDYVWRYVPNERIPFLKLEKVVFDNTSIINEAKIKANKTKIDEHINADKTV